MVLLPGNSNPKTVVHQAHQKHSVPSGPLIFSPCFAMAVNKWLVHATFHHRFANCSSTWGSDHRLQQHLVSLDWVTQSPAVIRPISGRSIWRKGQYGRALLPRRHRGKGNAINPMSEDTAKGKQWLWERTLRSSVSFSSGMATTLLLVEAISSGKG